MSFFLSFFEKKKCLRLFRQVTFELRFSENLATIRLFEDTENVNVDSYGLSTTLANINSALFQVNAV